MAERITATFAFERETKNTYRYAETEEPGAVELPALPALDRRSRRVAGKGVKLKPTGTIWA